MVGMTEAAIIVFISLVGLCMVIAISGVVLIALVRAFKGGKRGPGGKAEVDESRIIQELHTGLLRMEQRVESLETLLLDKVDRRGSQAGSPGAEER